MKKKVRIYKAPDGKGMFVNKTAKFLNRAQEGGQQDKQAQLADYVYKTLDDAEPFEFESIKESLINELASAQIPIDQAEGMVENIAASLSNEAAQAQEIVGEEEAGMYDQAQEDLRAQEEAAAAAEEERQASLAQDYGYYDDTAAQGEDTEDEEDYDDEEEAAYMQMGGDLIPEANAVSFTGYDPEQYYQDTQNSFSKGGITKRKYIGSVMKMLKKQEGGEGDKNSQMDPMDTASNEKKKKKDAFIGALASSAKEAKMKEKAEAMWEQQQQAMMQQQAPQYPIQPPMEQVPMAQRGLSINHGGHIGQQLRGPSPRQMRRMMPRGFGRNQMQSFAGMVPQGGMFPMGMNIMTYPEMQMPEQKPIHVQGTPQGMKLDVRKSNWLTGRPSQYSIEFGGDAAIPGFNMMPGMGYGAKSKQRKTIEGVSKLVNKNADPAKKEVDPVTGDTKLTLNTTGTYNQDAPSGTITTVDAQGNPISKYVPELDYNVTKSQTEERQKANAAAAGNGSNLPTKSATAKTNTATASKNVGQTKKTNLGQNLKEVTITGNKKALPKKADSYTSIPAGAKKATTWKRPASAYETGYNADDFGGVTDWLFNSSSPSKSAPAAPSSDGGVWNTVKNGLNFLYPGMGNLQDGGFVDSTNPDLYKFIYGGNEQFPDPITQQDMDYADSKNTASPYFANGGYVKYQDKGEVKEDDYDKYQREKAEKEAADEYNAYMNRGEGDKSKMVAYKANPNDAIYNKILGQSRKKYNLADPNEKPKTEVKKTEVTEDDDDSGNQNYNGYGNNRGYTGYPQNAFNRYFPANTIRNLGTYSQQMGMPYGADGAAYTGGFGPNTNLTKIDVRKSGWLSGKPKKYTMHFNNYSIDPALSKYLDETEGAAGSGDGSANTADLNSKGINPETGTSFTPQESQTWRERRQNRAYDKFMAEGRKMSDGEEEDVTEGGPSAEEIAARDAATLANKDVVREFSDVEGEQNDPFGIGSPTAEDLARQDEMDRAPQDLSALRNANASGTQDYNQNQEMMNQLDEASFNAQQDQLSRQGQSGSMTQEQAANLLMNNPFSPGYSANQQGQQNLDQEPMDGEEEQFSGGQNMYQNSVPGFGDDMSGVPMMNETISPWSLPDGFNPNTGMEQGDGSGSAPYAENLPFENQGDESDMFGYDVKGQRAQQRQRQPQQQQQQQRQQSRQNQNVNQGSNRNAAAQDSKSKNYDPKTFDAQGIVKKAKGQQGGYDQLLDSELGKRTMFAIDHQWEKDKTMQKKYGTYDNYLKAKGYWDLVQADKKKEEKIASNNRKANSKKPSNWGGGGADYQYGGNLNRFIYGDEVTKTSTGADSPISNINNPTNSFLQYDESGKLIIPGFGNPEQDKKKNELKLSLYKGYGEGDDFSAAPAGSTFTKDEQGNDVVISPDEARKRIKENSFAMDFKNKNAYEVDAEGVLNSANAGARGVLNFFEKRGQKKANKNFYDRFTADNLYAGDPIRDRGDYEANSGLYRPDEQGQTWNSRSARYGGFMQSGGFVEGDIVDMTPEEIQEFLANGGELEMIS